ncbi:MAG: RNA polymerase sigma-I factor [Bacillota bacterium]
MIKFNFFKKDSHIKDPALETIMQIKQGNEQLKNRFIEDYKPFIIKCVSKFTGKFVELENSEEFSIGLLAFNEAIDCFDESKNRSFISFAAQVINRRLINYKVSNKKNNVVYPFTYLENDDKQDIETLDIDFNAADLLGRFEVKEEIDSFKQRLAEFGITIYDLVKCSPKHKDAISSCIKIARVIADNSVLYNKLYEKKTMPMSELSKLVNVSQRTIERNRKFIIAACLIIKSDLDIVKGYLKNAEKAGN